jgi:serine/threonine protein kinase
MSLTVGDTFAGYRIVELIGAGGMGQVYLVEHPRLPRYDALKVLPADLTADQSYRARFEREANIAATLSHPNIVGIYDRGEVDGQFWIAMEFVEGTDAAHLMREQYPSGMPTDEVVDIVTGVASALDYAHHFGLLHRDVKPANILLTNPDSPMRRVFLADFGIARRMDEVAGLTLVNMALGTVAYAAPEQMMGEDVDGRADQYALACTAFHFLTGSLPYQSSNAAVVINKHVTAPPPSIGERRAEFAYLDPIFAKALAKDPNDRYALCQDFARELGRQLALGPAPAPEPPSFEPAPVYAEPASFEPAPVYPAPATWQPGPPPTPEEPFENRFAGPLTVDPRSPVRNKQVRPGPILAGLGAVLVAALGIWLLWPSSDEPGSASADTTTSAPRTADPEAQAKLLRVLPPGYPPNSCKPASLPQNALARVECGQNGDTDGPSSATYTLLPDQATLRAALDDVVGATNVVMCPGDIQSPGPWRRHATPDQVSGTVVCGVQQGRPTVAWTDDAESLLSVTRAEAGGPTLDQLYAWWSSHS